MKTNYKGFALLELLIVVIIVAVLAAVAWPQYKHAVLKSHFSKVMPVAKAVADANEIFYLGKNYYAQEYEKEMLDVAPATGGDISVALSETDGYDYVMAQNSEVPGTHYIMYQKHSENYPGEIHCEAENENADANWLCGVLSNNDSIGKTVTDGYTTYLINGGGVGFPVGYNALLEKVDCTDAEALGFTCTQTVDEENNTATKKICTRVGGVDVCRTRTYNEDGSYTSVTCLASYGGQCTSPLNWTSATYDANGNKISTRVCAMLTAGICTAWSGADYTYDANGNQLTYQTCISADSSGNCIAYGSRYESTYDANGNKTFDGYCDSSGMANDGTCSSYIGDSTNYTYDANGNMLTKNQGSNKWYYTYDANGNMLTSRQCYITNADGSCKSYAQGYAHYDYTYDADGRKLSQRTCTEVNSDGSCKSYTSFSENFDYAYNGNIQTAKGCGTMNADGSCSTYMNITYKSTQAAMIVYDENGNELAALGCNTDGNSFNSATGECNSYALRGNGASMIAN